MGSNLTKTWMYLKKINQDNKSLLFVFLWGLIFEIAWIIPAFDIFSLIAPVIVSIKYYVISFIFGLFHIRTYNPSNALIFAYATYFLIFASILFIYLFFHCKAYYIVVKKILNFKSDVEIKDLFIEKSNIFKKYFGWELSCFFIKLLLIVALFIGTKFIEKYSGIGCFILILIFVFLYFDLYTILTRLFVVPVFISNRYEDLSSKGIFEIPKRIFSLKLFVPIIIIGIIFIFSNILAIVIFIAIVKASASISWYLSTFLFLVSIFVFVCFAYHVGLFVFIYSCSCQQLIFPEYPLLLSSESEDGKIENVYSVFEKENGDDL